MVKEKILPKNCIYVNIPQKYLRKLFYSHRFLTAKEHAKIIWKLRQIEVARNQLDHAASIVGRILLKSKGTG